MVREGKKVGKLLANQLKRDSNLIIVAVLNERENMTETEGIKYCLNIINHSTETGYLNFF